MSTNGASRRSSSLFAPRFFFIGAVRTERPSLRQSPSPHPAVLCLAGALFIPAPRNSQDNQLPEFKGGRSPATPCTCVNGNGNGKNGCDQGNRAGGDGQACLWWSQGCSIGCEKCATNSEGPHSRGPFHGTGPQSGKIGFRTRYCNATHNSAKSATNPTPLINSTLPLEAWTLNIGAEEGSEEDSYRFNPWRCVHSPSASALFDAGAGP